ncbi:hypothetical protein EDD18DRAFT_1346667 [Armillaria luteobubalina]|uniref:Uncharacterized protein n=1 Tax=Armillaria luteobubalina TaxID=153913 RepID=A0AA39QFR1_9AGAR|nr:hypothetical protein EDD18DRAFT_1346667 [Armillaria luteobubalina]
MSTAIYTMLRHSLNPVPCVHMLTQKRKAEQVGTYVFYGREVKCSVLEEIARIARICSLKPTGRCRKVTPSSKVEGIRTAEFKFIKTESRMILSSTSAKGDPVKETRNPILTISDIMTPVDVANRWLRSEYRLLPISEDLDALGVTMDNFRFVLSTSNTSALWEKWSTHGIGIIVGELLLAPSIRYPRFAATLEDLDAVANADPPTCLQRYLYILFDAATFEEHPMQAIIFGTYHRHVVSASTRKSCARYGRCIYGGHLPYASIRIRFLEPSLAPLIVQSSEDSPHRPMDGVDLNLRANNLVEACAVSQEVHTGLGYWVVFDLGRTLPGRVRAQKW